MNKTILVVGGTQGIGAACCKKFIKEGASVIFTGRNQDLASQLQHSLLEKNPNASIEFKSFDVQHLSQVHEFTNKFKRELSAKNQKLDGVLFFAGGLNYGPRKEVEGLESTFAQNVASRFYITKALLPLLSDHALVLNCLSPGNGSALNPKDYELKQGFYFLKAAGTCAAMNDYLTLEFQKRFPKYRFIHYFPGIVATQSAKNQGFPWLIWYPASWVLPWIGKSPDAIADVIFDLFQSNASGLIGTLGNALPIPKYIQPELESDVWNYVQEKTKSSL